MKMTIIPHLFMIGRNGKIVANHLGYRDRTLDELSADINGVGGASYRLLGISI